MMKWLRKHEQANLATVPATEERVAWAAEIPGLFGKPLCAIQVEVVNTPQNEGSRWTLRGRLHTHLAALSSSSGESPTAAKGLAVQRLIGRVLDRRHQPAWLQRLSQPLLNLDFHTWLEFHASTAPLARGARDLMPESERLAALGVETPAGDGPLVRTWAGQSSLGREGFAQVSLLRFDKHHLPAAVAALFGRQPLHVAGAIVNVVEESD